MEENVKDLHGPVPDPLVHQRCELTYKQYPRIAWLHAGLTPMQARTENLVAVVGALESRSIDYFAVRGMEDRASTIGVHVDDQSQTLEALAELCSRMLGYVQIVIPKPRTATSLMAGNEARTWKKAAESRVLRITWFRTEPSRSLVCGTAYGCDIEFWKPEERPEPLPEEQRESVGVPARLISPRVNRVTRVLPVDAKSVDAPGRTFTRIAPQDDSLPQVRTRSEFTRPLPNDIDFPVDVVYTWVDGSDPAWQRRRAEASGEAYHAESASVSRFINHDELRYSLRSLHANAPWVRTIYIVSDDQIPAWLDVSVPGLKVVSHKEIFTDPCVLPTFNSHAIESQLHHIDGLSEHFLYFNDDMFIGRPIAPQAFFLPNGIAKYFPSQSRVPSGPIGLLDTPVDAATKNNRRLLEKRFGRYISQVMEHAPYAMRRSVLEELEREYPEEFRTTAGSHFRSLTDHNIPSNLAHYYGFFTGRALPGSLHFGYVGLAVKDLSARLERLLARRDRDAFCINDTFSEEEDVEAQNELITPFLQSYFPIPSPYEKALVRVGAE